MGLDGVDRVDLEDLLLSWGRGSGWIVSVIVVLVWRVSCDLSEFSEERGLEYVDGFGPAYTLSVVMAGLLVDGARCMIYEVWL